MIRRSATACGLLTNTLFQRALAVSGRVRTETRLSEGRISIASVAVIDFGKSIFDGPVTTFSDMPTRPRHAGPLIGEHTFEVLRDVLGYSEEEIGDIAATGALS